MKARMFGRSFLLAALLAGGCGSGSSAGGRGGGPGGAGGTGTGGTVGTGGTSRSNGGTGGSNTGGSAGSQGGSAGTAGREPGAGMLVDCPEPAPSNGDACSTLNYTCTYGSKSCACYDDGWHCSDCPASQPLPTDRCGVGPSEISLSCRYGSFTCSCNRNDGLARWYCGVCPASPPATGDVCGDSTFECRYGSSAICQCEPTGKWKCGTPTCPANAAFSMSAGCTAPGFYTCRYPDQDETCICGPDGAVGLTYPCTCPAATPTDGSACIGGAGTCSYDTATCTCGGVWHCSPRTCPGTQPTTGAACTTPLTCTYAASFCSCNGASWTCS